VDAKILIAFAAGAVLASGIVYVAVKPEQARSPSAEALLQPRPAVPAPLPAADTPPVNAPAAEVQPASDSASVPPKESLKAVVPKANVNVRPKPESFSRSAHVVREKPSAWRPPAQHESPVIVAQNTTPPAPQPAPPTLPSPINKERPYNDAPPVETPPVSTPPPESPSPQSAPSAPATTPSPTPAPPQEASAPQPTEVPQTRVPNTVTIQAGTILAVRIAETISSTNNEVGDGFLATLEQPLVVDGFIIAERGARVQGRVVEAERPGKAGGQSRLGIELIEFLSSDGQRVHVHTATVRKHGDSSVGSNLAKIGAGAAIGAVIGGAAAGGKGAGIGAGVGGAAGAAGAVLTSGKPAQIPVETRISFRIQDPVTLTERLN
jgi:hypothetical protein